MLLKTFLRQVRYPAPTLSTFGYHHDYRVILDFESPGAHLELHIRENENLTEQLAMFVEKNGKDAEFTFKICGPVVEQHYEKLNNELQKKIDDFEKRFKDLTAYKQNLLSQRKRLESQTQYMSGQITGLQTSKHNLLEELSTEFHLHKAAKDELMQLKAQTWYKVSQFIKNLLKWTI